jgi:hypothetical protein
MNLRGLVILRTVNLQFKYALWTVDRSYIGLFSVCSLHMDDHTLHSLHLISRSKEGYVCISLLKEYKACIICDCNCSIQIAVVGAYQFLD